MYIGIIHLYDVIKLYNDFCSVFIAIHFTYNYMEFISYFNTSLMYYGMELH